MSTIKKSATKKAGTKTAAPKKTSAKKNPAARKGNITPGDKTNATANKKATSNLVHYVREAGAPEQTVNAVILEGEIGGPLKLQVEGETIDGVMPDEQVPYGEHYYQPIA